MAIFQLGDRTPEIDPSAYVAESANVIGKAIIEAHASVWFNVTIRGDNEPITVGARSNVQDGCVLHTDPGFPLTIGHDVTVGHQAMLHGCSIGDGTLIGMQAVILNGARVGKNSLVAAGALITEGKEFPDNSLILGSPAKALRRLDEAAVAAIRLGAQNYVQRALIFKHDLKRIG